MRYQFSSFFLVLGVLIGISFSFLTTPSVAFAFPFGGQASIVVPCYNDAIYASLGPPKGGPYVWTKATRTYLFGPPRYSGQWLLGLAGAPYYCLVSRRPIITWAASSIFMMGSSGTASGGFGEGTGSGRPGGSIYTPGSQDNATDTTVSDSDMPVAQNRHIVVSEVFYAVDAAHGTSPSNQFVELYNQSPATVDLSGWVLESASSQSTIPNGTSLMPGSYLVLVADTNTQGYWSIPSGSRVVSLGNSIAGGLSTPGDYLRLRNTAAAVQDALSWGSNSTVFSVPMPPVDRGHSMARAVPSSDTDSSSDWVDMANPTPGR